MQAKIKNVLSLFDGMSCGQLALKRAGVTHGIYYAAEIDKFAIQVTQHNFPNTVQLGDVTKVSGYDLEDIDLLIGGSPCQGFSMAGKQLNFEDPRSKLFFEYVRILNELRVKNPNVKFLLENVRMAQWCQDVISRYLGVYPVRINSNLVSAQNRDRWYWTNIDFNQNIKDKGIFLRDILESDVDEKYYLSEKAISYITDKIRIDKGFTSVENDKALTLTAVYGNNTGQFVKIDKHGNVKDSQNKASCFTAGGNSGGNHSDMDLLVMKRQVIQLNPSLESGGKQPFQQNRVYDSNGIAPALCANLSTGSNNIIIPEATKKGFIEVSPGDCFDAENINSKTRRGRSMTDKSNCLMATSKTEFLNYTSNYRIRRLTPTECERLQTVDDGYTSIVSDSQRYKMLGNGWTIDIIAEIFKGLANEKTATRNLTLSLF